MNPSGERLRAAVADGVLRLIAGAVLHNHVVTQRVGLGASDSQFLSLLRLHGRLTPGALAELTGLTTGTVTGVIDRLERAGYVRRERDPDDRRKILVTPDPGAMARLAEHYDEHGAHLDAVLRSRSAAELEVIAVFLDDLTGAGLVNPDPRAQRSGPPADSPG